MKKKKEEKVYHMKKNPPAYLSIPGMSTGLYLCACLLTHRCVCVCVCAHTHMGVCVCVCVVGGLSVNPVNAIVRLLFSLSMWILKSHYGGFYQSLQLGRIGSRKIQIKIQCRGLVVYIVSQE